MLIIALVASEPGEYGQRMPLQSVDLRNVEAMPGDVAQTLLALGEALDSAVPARVLDRNLVIGSWNIRQLGGFTGKWHTAPGDSPKRNLADLHYIAEIISRFDVVAIQETRDDLAALRLITQLLGPDWGLLLSDVTHGSKGNQERLGYLFDLRRVRPSGLVGELVAPPEDLKSLRELRLARPLTSDQPQGKTAEERAKSKAAIELERDYGGQLDRTPYLASFKTAGRPFMLATVHLVWGDASDLERRADEAGLLAKLLAKTVSTPKGGAVDEFRSNLIALGDFNATAGDDPIIGALKSAGMETAAELDGVPRTTSDKGGPSDKIAYDQFAWFGAAGALNFPRIGGGGFPWDKYILQGVASNTFRISDHYPIWMEFNVEAA